MEYKQKKLSNAHAFNFKDEKLNFAHKDKGGSADFDVYYADIPFKTSTVNEHNEWLRNVGFMWILLGLIQISLSIYSNNFAIGKGFWLYIGVLCFIGFQFTKVIYTVFKTNEGNIFIIQDKKHDEIINEISTRRKKQFLSWYGEINLNNEIEKEINKFKWLQELNIITESEAEVKIAQVKMAKMKTCI